MNIITEEELSSIKAPKGTFTEKNSYRFQKNPLISKYNHAFFTAATEEQFLSSFDDNKAAVFKLKKKREQLLSSILASLAATTTTGIKFSFSKIYNHWTPKSTLNTFTYMFYHIKKGIYVRIQDNQLHTFLPFNNNWYVNRFHSRLPSYRSSVGFFKEVSESQGYKWNWKRVNKNMWNWRSNGHMIRYDANVSVFDEDQVFYYVFFTDLLSEREVPDIEFFINSRDFSVLTRNGDVEPYTTIYGEDFPLLPEMTFNSHTPVFSMSKSNPTHSDILMITWEDIIRVYSQEDNIEFLGKKGATSNYTFDLTLDWSRKSEYAVFRGASTGEGVTRRDNPRLKVVQIAKEYPELLIDAGITSINNRPRMYLEESGEIKFKVIEGEEVPSIEGWLTAEEQSQYKYIINLNGHTTAFRLSLELSFGSVVLLQRSSHSMWLTRMLEDMVHVVFVAEDLSDLPLKLNWLRANDDKARAIATNARKFYERHCTKEGLFNYMQSLLMQLSQHIDYNGSLHSRRHWRAEQLQFLLEEKQADIASMRKKVSDWEIQPGNKFPERTIMKFPHSCCKALEALLLTSRTGVDTFISPVSSKIREGGAISIDMVEFRGLPISVKKSEESKDKLMHSYLVGALGVNDLIKYYPMSFNYTLYLDDDNERDNNNTLLLSWFRYGEMLEDYLQSDRFNWPDFISILLQIEMILMQSFERRGFIHGDLYPYNIILTWTSSSSSSSQRLTTWYDNVEVKANVIPTLIDYDKSSYIWKGQVVGFDYSIEYRKPYYDICMLILSSICTLIKSRRIYNNSFDLQMINYLLLPLQSKRCIAILLGKSRLETLNDIILFVNAACKFSVFRMLMKYYSADLQELDHRKMLQHLINTQHTTKINYLNSPRIVTGNPYFIADYFRQTTDFDRQRVGVKHLKHHRLASLPKSDDANIRHYLAEVYSSMIYSYRLDIPEIEKSLIVETTQKINRLYREKNLALMSFSEDLDAAKSSEDDLLSFHIPTRNVYITLASPRVQPLDYHYFLSRTESTPRLTWEVDG